MDELVGIKELIELTMIETDEQLEDIRSESSIDPAASPTAAILFNSVDVLLDQNIFVRPCGCEFHFNESSFEFFECVMHATT